MTHIASLVSHKRWTHMNQLTIRGLDDDLSASVRRLAKREGISLNQAALRLLRKGAGLADRSRGSDLVGSSLDHLIGRWTPDRSGRDGLGIGRIRDC